MKMIKSENFQDYIKCVKYIVIFASIFTFWVFVIHESLHSLACAAQGYEAIYTFVSSQPSVECIGLGPSNEPGQFLTLMAPYILEIFILLGFLFNKNKRIIVRLIPHIVFMDLAGNFFFSYLLNGRDDFMQLAANAPSLFWLSLPLVCAIILIWVFGYRKDFQDFYDFIRPGGNN